MIYLSWADFGPMGIRVKKIETNVKSTLGKLGIATLSLFCMSVKIEDLPAQINKPIFIETFPRFLRN